MNLNSQSSSIAPFSVQLKDSLPFSLSTMQENFRYGSAPEQVRIIPIADKHVSYAEEVKKELAAKGYRVKVDEPG